MYIIKDLKEGKIPTTAKLKEIIKNLAGSLGPYESYLRTKKEEKEQEVISVEIAIKIYEYLKREIEIWEKRKK